MRKTDFYWNFYFLHSNWGFGIAFAETIKTISSRSRGFNRSKIKRILKKNIPKI